MLSHPSGTPLLERLFCAPQAVLSNRRVARAELTTRLILRYGAAAMKIEGYLQNQELSMPEVSEADTPDISEAGTPDVSDADVDDLLHTAVNVVALEAKL